MKFDQIGRWSEIKLEIVRKYAAAYSTILARQKGLTHYYIDGFAGPGVQRSRSTGAPIAGSPLSVLEVQPPFKRYFLIDIKGQHIAQLRKAVGQREDVELDQGDCNEILLKKVFPQVTYRQFRRALCLLDPDGLHLTWPVIAMAGQLKTIDLLLNFPIMDMNRNALWTRPDLADPADTERMTAWWGDTSWRDVVYRPSAQGHLFGAVETAKAPNEAVVRAFQRRLVEVAGFENVPDPIPMRNSANSVIYYLFFASQYAVASRIAADIFQRYARDQ